MVDLGQNRAPVGDLGLVNGRHQIVAAGLLQRRLDLTGDAFELWIRHDQRKIRSRQIGEASDVPGVVRRHHNRERIGYVGHGRSGQKTLSDQVLNLLEAGEIGVRLRGPGHVARRHRAAGFDLLDKQAWRKGLPIDVALETRMLVLESFNKRRHGEEIITADIEHELGVRKITVEVRKAIDLRNEEREPAAGRVVVGSVLPRRKDRILLHRLGGLRRPQRHHESGCKQRRSKNSLAHAGFLTPHSESRPAAAPESLRRFRESARYRR